MADKTPPDIDSQTESWSSADGNVPGFPRPHFVGGSDSPPDTSREIEGLARRYFGILLLIFGAVAMFASFVIAGMEPKSRDPEIEAWKLNFLTGILIAIGTSIFSSMVFYLFYSGFLEKRVLRDVTTNAAKAAASYASSLYQNRFNRMMPSHVYAAANSPRPEFEKHLDYVLKGSRIYKFKGDDGGFTAFRIDRLCRDGHLLDKEIIVLLLDPREDYLLRERAKIELAESNPQFSKQELEDHIQQMRTSIFATVVALFDISHKIRGEVAFHKEHLFFRSEIFDGGIFLTYYLGGEFPTTCFFPRTTLTYLAYLENFRQNYKNAEPKMAFKSQTGEGELRAQLDGLGCSQEISELRQFKANLFQKYGNMTG